MNLENTTSIHLFDLPHETLLQIFEGLDFATRVELFKNQDYVSKKFWEIFNADTLWLSYFREKKRSFVKKPRQILVNPFKQRPLKEITADEYMEGITAIKPSTFLIHPDAQEARKKLQAIMDNKRLYSTQKQAFLRKAASHSLASALIVITWPACHQILAGNITQEMTEKKVKLAWLAQPFAIEDLKKLSVKYLIVFKWIIEDAELKQAWLDHGDAVYYMYLVARNHLEAFRWIIEDKECRKVWLAGLFAVGYMCYIAKRHLEAFRWIIEDTELKQAWLDHDDAVKYMRKVAKRHLEAFRWIIEDAELKQAWLDHDDAVENMCKVASAHDIDLPTDRNNKENLLSALLQAINQRIPKNSQNSLGISTTKLAIK